MPVVELTELGTSSHLLSTEQGERLARSGLVRAAPSALLPGHWDLAARGTVGVARVGDLELWIKPKLDIARLLFLIGYASDPKGWRDDEVDLGTGPGLVPAIAQALWRQSERALRRGLLPGYHEMEETAYVLRGRLREADQVRRRPGQLLPLELRHDEFTVDIAENRILLAAITRMLTVSGVDDNSRTRLVRLRRRLAEVTTPLSGTQLPPWRPSRLNARYHTALRLAEIVWRATSPEHTPGLVRTAGFLFNLPVIFEDFVTTALTEALSRRTVGTARRQFPCSLDEAGTVSMYPDLVWQAAGQAVAVADAKYKQETVAGYPNPDLYQMLAYCTTLGLTRGHLVYARGNADPARHVVRRAGIEIVGHALDLTAQPTALLGQIDQLARQLLET